MNQSLHVVMLSDHETAGGAAIAASRLANGLLEAGAKVTRLVARPDGQRHPWETMRLLPSRTTRVMRLLQAEVESRLGAHLLPVDWVTIHPQLRNLLKLLEPDVISVHNIHGARLWPDLLSLCTVHAPTVWTLHDMWSFTGGCAYSYDCRRFASGCDTSCPEIDYVLGGYRRSIRHAWRLRRRLFVRHPDLVAVCPSGWLSEQASAGLWQGHRIEVIPNGLDLETYIPLDRAFARRALGISVDGPVVMMAAQSLASRWKGTQHLVESLQRVGARPLAVLTLGEGDLDVLREGIHVVPLGYIDHERTKVLAYNAADLLVHPATADNLPNVIIEALACGTPTVAFPVGGVPELVRPDRTGWLARDVTSESLTESMEHALQAITTGHDLRASCREVAQNEYALDLQAQRHLSLFRSLQRERDLDALPILT